MSEEGEDEDKKPSPIEARIAQVNRMQVLVPFSLHTCLSMQRWQCSIFNSTFLCLIKYELNINVFVYFHLRVFCESDFAFLV